MSRSVHFTVPGAPQGKGRGRIVRIAGQSRIATPAKTVAYEGLVAMAAQQAMAGEAPMAGPVRCVISVACAIPESWSKTKRRDAATGALLPAGKPDLDNVAKAILDGCNGVVWVDDKQVTSLEMRKRYSELPGVSVLAEPVRFAKIEDVAA